MGESSHSSIALDSSIVSGLNPEQLLAVKHGDGPLLILAGAGTGKTRVIVHRVAYLIKDRKINPGSILAVTFTNKAANEMKERVEKLLGCEANGITIRTFHSLGLHILRDISQRLKRIIPPGFSIYDEDDKERLIKQCIGELGWKEELDVDKTSEFISGAKAELITAEKYFTLVRLPSSQKISKVYELYQNKLNASHAFDFDDLIMMPVVIFEKNKEILDYYQKKYEWILIDEYQDVNYAQYKFVKLLSGKLKNLCVVGDPDQSIYTWRGANLRNILEFEKDYPEAKVLKLEYNYRSTQRILKTATKLIKNNKMRKDKILKTNGNLGEKIQIFETLNEHDEAKCIVATILSLINSGYKHSDISILYRTHAQSRLLEEMLIRYNLPYVIIGGIRFYQRKEIKDILAYLKLIVNPDDEVSLWRVLDNARGVGKTTISKLRELSNSLMCSPFKIVEQEAQNYPKLKDVLKNYNEIKKEIKDKKLAKLIEIVLEKTNYLEKLTKKTDCSSQDRIENLEELINAADDFENSLVNLTTEEKLEQFLQHLSLYTDFDIKMGSHSSIVLMTAHNAKGLEFPVVFITGLEEGLFPHFSALNDKDELEEERRLLFVGITRAKERVYLFFANKRKTFLETANEPSRFISEIIGDTTDLNASPTAKNISTFSR